MVNFRVDGRLVLTTYLTAKSPDYIVNGLSITSPAAPLRPVVVKAIAFAVENSLKAMNVDGVQINRTLDT